MDRVAAFLGVLGLSAATGALAFADLILVPGLSDHALLDPNQAVSVSAPLHLRCAEVALVGIVVLALSCPRWLGSRLATTVSLLALTCAGVSRLILLPTLYEAWGKVDLVAGRPVARVAEAKELAGQAVWLDLGLAFLLLALIAISTTRRVAAPAPRQAPAPAPPQAAVPEPG